MKEIKSEENQWLSQNATKRKTWYFSVAQAYDKVRPRYPQKIIEFAIELAQVPPEAKIIEVGCGPGITSEVLQDHGSLILLWNMSLQPQYEVYQALNEVYDIYAPSLVQYEDHKKQEKILKELGHNVVESGYFKDLVSKHLPCKITYNTDNYLMLLSTLSPYIGLDSKVRNALFEGLKEKIEKNYGGKIQLSYLSAVQVAQKSKS